VTFVTEIDNIAEHIEMFESNWLDHRKRMDKSWISSTNLVDGGMWEDQDEDGETKKTLSF
jgi:hypothetical protein